MTWAHPSRNPAQSRILSRASMVIGNEVTLWQLSRKTWSRCQPHASQGGILQEANASGKARGYADVETITENVTLGVAMRGNPRITQHFGVSDERSDPPLLQRRSYRALA